MEKYNPSKIIQRSPNDYSSTDIETNKKEKALEKLNEYFSGESISNLPNISPRRMVFQPIEDLLKEGSITKEDILSKKEYVDSLNKIVEMEESDLIENSYYVLENLERLGLINLPPKEERTKNRIKQYEKALSGGSTRIRQDQIREVIESDQEFIKREDVQNALLSSILGVKFQADDVQKMAFFISLLNKEIRENNSDKISEAFYSLLKLQHSGIKITRYQGNQRISVSSTNALKEDDLSNYSNILNETEINKLKDIIKDPNSHRSYDTKELLM